jgi:hypothetical protein
MSDTQRLDWLERNPKRLLICSEENGSYKFRFLLKADPSRPAELNWSEPYDTLRDALDEGMKGIL